MANYTLWSHDGEECSFSNFVDYSEALNNTDFYRVDSPSKEKILANLKHNQKKEEPSPAEVLNKPEPINEEKPERPTTGLRRKKVTVSSDDPDFTND